MQFNYDSLPIGYYDFEPRGVRYRWHKVEFLTVESLVRRKTPQILIDLGCGPGTFLRNYCSFVSKKVGFDISANQITYASLKSPDKILFTSNKEDLMSAIENGTSDLNKEITGFSACITLLQLVEHISSNETYSIINEISSLLKRQGATEITVIMTTPNKFSAWPFLEKLVDIITGTNYRDQHINIMSPKVLLDRFSGLTSSKVHVFGFMTFAQWLILSPPCKLIKQFTIRCLLLIAIVNI